MVGPVPPPAGGIATSVINILNSELSNHFEIIHLDSSTKRPVNKKGVIDFLNLISCFHLLLKFFKIYLTQIPDIVQIESSSGISFLKNSILILISNIFNTKIIISIHGSGVRFIQFYKNLPVVLKKYIKFVLSRCDAIRLLSEKWVSSFVSELNIIDNNIYIIPNGVVISRVLGNNQFQKVNFYSDFNILYLGWIGQRKGIFDLIDASKILKNKRYDFKLLLVGPEMKEGDKDRVIHYIKDKGLNNYIRLFKEIEYNEVFKFYNAAHIYALPSYTEGLPMGILEAMAVGLPIVSTKVGAIPEIVEEGINGFLIKPGDVVGLAYSIERLIKDKELRERMKENNKEKIKQKYSIQRQVNMFTKLYFSILEV